MKTLFKFTIALFAFLFFAGAIAEATGATPEQAIVALAIFSGTSVLVRLVVLIANPFAEYNKTTGMALAITTEIWEDFIASNLYKQYPWLLRAKDRSNRVLNNSVVHIPQAGAAPGTQRNRAVYPVPVLKRSDSDLTYVIDEISGDATHIKNAEMIELSYDKINDVLGDYTNQLGKDTARNALFRWLNGLNAANIVRTTGADTAVYMSGQTGTRDKLTVADIGSGKTILNSQTKKDMRAPGKGALILGEEFYNQLKSDSVLTDRDTVDSVGGMWKDGDLVKVHGFDIIRTDVMPRFDNATNPVAKDPFPSIVEAATDNDVAMLIDFDFAHIAKGSIEFFETLADAQYQGDIYSALVRMGAARERSDQAGVVAVVQKP